MNGSFENGKFIPEKEKEPTENNLIEVIKMLHQAIYNLSIEIESMEVKLNDLEKRIDIIQPKKSLLTKLLDKL